MARHSEYNVVRHPIERAVQLNHLSEDVLRAENIFLNGFAL